MRDSAYIIKHLNRRYRKAAIVETAKTTGIVLLGVGSWGVLAGLINYIR